MADQVIKPSGSLTRGPYTNELGEDKTIIPTQYIVSLQFKGLLPNSHTINNVKLTKEEIILTPEDFGAYSKDDLESLKSNLLTKDKIVNELGDDSSLTISQNKVTEAFGVSNSTLKEDISKLTKLINGYNDALVQLDQNTIISGYSYTVSEMDDEFFKKEDITRPPYKKMIDMDAEYSDSAATTADPNAGRWKVSIKDSGYDFFGGVLNIHWGDWSNEKMIISVPIVMVEGNSRKMVIRIPSLTSGVDDRLITIDFSEGTTYFYIDDSDYAKGTQFWLSTRGDK